MHILMGRADVEPEFMPADPIYFDDPITEGSIDRDAVALEPVSVCVYRQNDGAIVVQVDYSPITFDEARVRVNINDATIYDRNIENGIDYGDDVHPYEGDPDE